MMFLASLLYSTYNEVTKNENKNKKKFQFFYTIITTNKTVFFNTIINNETLN